MPRALQALCTVKAIILKECDTLPSSKPQQCIIRLDTLTREKKLSFGDESCLARYVIAQQLPKLMALKAQMGPAARGVNLLLVKRARKGVLLDGFSVTSEAAHDYLTQHGLAIEPESEVTVYARGGKRYYRDATHGEEIEYAPPYLHGMVYDSQALERMLDQVEINLSEVPHIRGKRGKGSTR